MAISVFKTFSAGEILTASDLNASLTQITGGGISLISPATGALDMSTQQLTLDGDTHIRSSVSDRMDFTVGGVALVTFDATAGSPINGLDIVAGVTTAAPVIRTNSEVDIGLTFSNIQNEEMLSLSSAATAITYIGIASAAASTNPIISAQGEADTGIEFHNSEAEEILILEPVDAALNEITITNAVTGENPSIAATGEDNRGIDFEQKDGDELLVLAAVDAAVNEVTITNAATGNDPTIIPSGETNVGLTLQGKGTGTVKLGDASLVFPDADGSAGDSIVTDGAGTLSLATAALPRSYLAGCQLTRTDANTITIAVGQARNTGDDTNIVLAASLAKDIDTTWAAGAGGGLNATDFAAGTNDAEADTWYHVFLIEDGSGTIDAGFDQNIAATNLLSDSSYTKYRRIGAVRTDGAKDIMAFVQYGNYFLWTTVQDVDDAVAGATQNLLDLAYTPDDLNIEAVVNVYVADSSDVFGNIASGDAADVAASTTTGACNMSEDTSGSTARAAGQYHLWTDTSRQIQHRWTAALDAINFGVVAYYDTRGRDD